MKEVLDTQNPLQADGAPCFVIAELGTGFTEDLRYARELVEAAKQAGADCVKVQIVFADEIVHPLSGKINLPSGKIALYDHFKTCERDFDYYSHVREYAEQCGLLFLCSVFGTKSVRMAERLNVKMLKVASPELNHLPLLKAIAHLKRPVILSTGVSRLGDIEKALTVITGNTALLHCVTSYPAPEKEYNLKVLPSLKALFGVPVGVSDHTVDPELVPAAAVICGASIIEKHFTLRKQGKALDDPIAVNKSEFERMVRTVRKVESMPREEACRFLNRNFGRDRVKAVLGDGIKKLAASEKENFYTTRRSILALTDIRRGEAFSAHNTALLRSEKNLAYGLSPEFLPLIYGRKARRRIEAGRGIAWKDID